MYQQLDLKLNATMNRPIDLTAWQIPQPRISRGVMLVTLSALGWSAVWFVCRLFL